MEDEKLVRNVVLDNIPLAVFCFDKKGRVFYANSEACKSISYNKEDVLSKTIFDINIAVTEESWQEHLDEIREKKVIQFNATHSDSRSHHFEVEVIACYFSNKRKEWVCAFVRNISNSDFYKDILIKAESLAKLAGWKWNLQDQSFITTEEAHRIFKTKDKNELHPHRLVSLIKDKEKFSRLYAEAITQKKPFNEVFETLEKPRRFIRAITSPKLKNNKTYKLFGVFQDVTEQKTGEADLAFFKEVLDSAEDLVYIYNQEGKLLYYNNSVAEKLGFSHNELDHFTIYDLDSGITPQWWAKHFNEIIQKGAVHLEWLVTRKDGTKFPADITAHYLRYNGEAINCAVVRDITEKKMRDLALHEALLEIRTLKKQTDAENRYLQEEIKKSFNNGKIISVNPRYRQVLKLVSQVAPTDASVLITGESGTGKELLATAIHEQSRRYIKPLIKVNCAALPHNLFESEFFGHKKGAFTGAIKDRTGKFKLADNGTIFLDEIGELPLDLQPKLLRVLQEGEFDELGGKLNIKTDVRIIAATNRDLEKLVDEGKFREDLFYRLNVFPVHSLPLRERPEDIRVLANFFLKKYAKKNGKALEEVSSEALAKLRAYSFPGNIRELENIIERATITENGRMLYPGAWLPDSTKEPDSSPLTFQTFEQMQKQHILKALSKTSGKVSGQGGAAELLGMNPKTLFGKMKKLGIR